MSEKLPASGGEYPIADALLNAAKKVGALVIEGLGVLAGASRDVAENGLIPGHAPDSRHR